MEIAILAWGSLIWRPTHCGETLALQVPGQWEQDGPSLPVEFARISRDGSLTLVVVPGYPHQVRTLWSVSSHKELDPAIRNLATREGITENLSSIHGVRRDGSRIGSVDDRIASTALGWLLERPTLDAVIWTGLGTQPGRWRDRGYTEGFTPDNAVSYLRSLQDEETHPAHEYMRRTPAQITSPIRQRATAEGFS
ncbi:MAG: hypothetical protein P1T08_03235 [Acidimicrobiia bacterium]|nr:hypothetical protein [Acidimicrobiia bacterium]